MPNKEKLISINNLYLGILFKIITPLFFMSLFRFILYLLNRQDFDGLYLLDILEIFLMGLRFDVLIWGFILILPTLILLAAVFINEKLFKTKLESIFIKIVNYGFSTVWLLIISLTFADFIFYSMAGNRMVKVDIGNFNLFQINIFIIKYGYTTFTLVSLILIVSSFIGIREIIKRRSAPAVAFLNKLPLFVLLLLPLLITSMMARGTLRAHHLRYEDSLISENQKLNQLALTPAWTFNK